MAETMEVSKRADFCVGYLNLRGWRLIDEYVKRWEGGEGHCCRLLVGMQRLPQEEFRVALSLSVAGRRLENAVNRLDVDLRGKALILEDIEGPNDNAK